MPNNKKISPARRSKTAGHNGSSKSNADEKLDPMVALAEKIEERCSIEYAIQLEDLFKKSYPPKIVYENYLKTLSKTAAKKVESAYSKVSRTYNAGLEKTKSHSNAPGISRWHLVIDKLLDAVGIVVNEAPDAFLRTITFDHRTLLSKICLTIAQCRGKSLDYEGQQEWAKVAIAADPTYFNGYNQLGLGYMNDKLWVQALEATERAHELLQTTETDFTYLSLPNRLMMLRKVVKDDDKEARRTMVLESRGQAIRWWQELSVERPAKTCALCYRPGDKKCSKCKSVYYCSRDCQLLDFKEHKRVCVEPAKVRKQLLKPEYPASELCSDEMWECFLNFQRKMREESILIPACNNCSAATVKRALMNGEDPNKLSVTTHDLPILMVALRREPENALNAMKALLDYGACPNVVRADDKHLIEICRSRAKWIDDAKPSRENEMFRSFCGLAGDGVLEKMERNESEELVKLVTEAIREHKLCRHCKARKRNRRVAGMHLHTENLTDFMMAYQETHYNL